MIYISYTLIVACSVLAVGAVVLMPSTFKLRRFNMFVTQIVCFMLIRLTHTNPETH